MNQVSPYFAPYFKICYHGYDDLEFCGLHGNQLNDILLLKTCGKNLKFTVPEKWLVEYSDANCLPITTP